MQILAESTVNVSTMPYIQVISLAFTLPMPLKPTFRVHIPSSVAQENVLPSPPTTVTFALPGSAAEDLIRQAPAPKPQAVYNILKSQLSTWNLNTPNAGEKYK